MFEIYREFDGKKELIDDAQTKQDAIELCQEYIMAFATGVVSYERKKELVKLQFETGLGVEKVDVDKNAIFQLDDGSQFSIKQAKQMFNIYNVCESFFGVVDFYGDCLTNKGKFGFIIYND